MSKPLRVLIVEDSKPDAELLRVELVRGGYEPISERVDTAEAMSEALARGTWDIVLADYVMPRFSGLAALQLLQSTGCDLPFIVVSGQIGEDIAVGAMKAGASDYILKGRLARLVPAVEREMREAEVRQERRKAQEERDRLMEQLRSVNEQLVLSSLRSTEQAEQVERQAAELDAVIRAIAEPLVIFGPTGEITRMNATAVEVLGYSPGNDEKPPADLLSSLRIETDDGRPFPTDEGPIARTFCGETVRGARAVIHDRPHATPIRVSISTAPVRTADNQIRGAVAVFATVKEPDAKGQLR